MLLLREGCDSFLHNTPWWYTFSSLFVVSLWSRLSYQTIYKYWLSVHHVRVVCWLSPLQLFGTPWTVAHQAPPAMQFYQARILDWVPISSSKGSSQTRDQTCICCFPALAGGFFTTEPPEKKHNDEQNVLFIVWGTNCLERCALWPFFITHFTLWHTHLLSHGQLFATLWTGARQAPLSIGVSRQEYWSGLPFSSPGDFSPPRDQTSVSCVSCIGRQIL